MLIILEKDRWHSDGYFERLENSYECEPNSIFFRFGSKELTGEYPPETPYTPGTPLPPIRRRVRTAFEFSEFIISGENDKVNKLINIDSF